MPILKGRDGDLYYELSGQGSPVLLIQGVGTAGETWRPQVLGLQHEFQTLLFDNRGIGRSVPLRGKISIAAMAEDAAALIEAAGWSSVHVVGHSMGGIIAQQLALDFPKRVRSLSLLCTFSKGKEAARLTPWVLWMTLRTRVGSTRMRRHAFLEMLISKQRLESADLDALATQYGRMIGRDLSDQPPILMKQVMAMGRNNCSARLGELSNIPTLVVSADEDRIAQPRFGRRLAELIPGAGFKLITGASHGVTLEKPDETNRLLGDFFRQIDGTRTSRA